MNFAQAAKHFFVTRVTAKIKYEVCKRHMPRERRYYVYMLASKGRALYVGVNGALMLRVLRHKAGRGGVFTRKYRVNRLVWYQSFESVGNENNPTWEDLAADWGTPVALQYLGPGGEKQSLP